VLCWLFAGYLLGVFFDSEDGASILMWNVGEVMEDNTASHPRRWRSSSFRFHPHVTLCPLGLQIFTLSPSIRSAVRSTQPPIQLLLGTVFFPGVKRTRREADHSPPASAELKKIWIYTSTPHTPSFS
jgi:hypothetical protein